MSIFGLVERTYYQFHPRGDVVACLLAQIPARSAPIDVLEFGGGTGRVSRALARERAGTFTLADANPLTLARVGKDPAFRPLLFPETGPLPLPEKSFDYILAIDVLHHVPDAAATLRELTRSLRRGGRIFIVEFEAARPVTRALKALSVFRRQPCTFWAPHVKSSD